MLTTILAPGRKNQQILTDNSEAMQQIITRTGFSGPESNIQPQKPQIYCFIFFQIRSLGYLYIHIYIYR